MAFHHGFNILQEKQKSYENCDLSLSLKIIVVFIPACWQSVHHKKRFFSLTQHNAVTWRFIKFMECTHGECTQDLRTLISQL